MSLQYKISALLLAVFLMFGVLIYSVQQLLILPSFLALEINDAEKDMQRVLQTIQRETAMLAQQTSDWSSWDDTYRFMADSNTEFRNANLNKQDIFDLLRIDLLYFVNDAGKIVWSVVYDRQTGEEIRLPELGDTVLPLDHPLIALNSNQKHKGLLSTSHAPLIVAAKPSLDSDGNGPARGALVFGRFLDKSAVARIARQARVNLAFILVQNSTPDAEHSAVIRQLGSTRDTVIRGDERENRVYHILPDIFGKPAVLLQVTSPKLISAQGRAANRNARLALAGAAMLILLVLLIGLRRVILIPIAQLIAHADQVGRRDDLSIRLDTERKDELGDLAREFNHMIERLAEARKTVQEQSRQAGIAELASGVLHNIGNAITPLKVRVAKLESALRAAPTAEIDMALVELEHANIPDERRRDLRTFLDLGVRELSTLLKATVEQLVGVAQQVEHVQKILSDQENISRATRVLQPVVVAELVKESVELLGTEMPRSLHIELDDSLRAVDRVLGSPVALQQIVINLLKNAAESIRTHAAAAQGGRIRLQAAAEDREGRAMVRLCISDNGAGVAPENLPRLFQRGFSTKARPSGQGLHWCAITATALGGKITIDSAGTGQGATVSLWLPRA